MVYEKKGRNAEVQDEYTPNCAYCCTGPKPHPYVLPRDLARDARRCTPNGAEGAPRNQESSRTCVVKTAGVGGEKAGLRVGSGEC
jgi:hypothetical protein